jgi:hypothetical protein
MMIGEQCARNSDPDLLDFVIYVGHHFMKLDRCLFLDAPQQQHMVVVNI